MPEIGAAIRALVRERARGRCEYCRISEEFTLHAHEVDHIVAVKHGGPGSFENLALSCVLCNKHKGADLASNDPVTGLLEPLFNPRRENWRDHFIWRDAEIAPLTGIGRVTVRLLQFNRSDRIAERKLML
jgi:5-methylcytosine-specific restriction endonuclease McrA